MKEATEQKTTQEEAQPNPPVGWARGALKRGFFSAVQAYEAGNLALTMLMPKTMKRLGFHKITGGTDALSRKVSGWEDHIDRHDIEPEKPGYMKSATSFLLFNTAYVLPIVIAGLGVGLVAGDIAGLIAAGIINTHATIGEALVQTAQGNSVKLKEKAAFDKSLKDDVFNKVAKHNIYIKGGICVAFTLAAGPIARFLGSFTGGALKSITRTPLGRIASQKLIEATQHSLIKSISSGLGVIFGNAVIANGKGPASILGKVSTSLLFVKGATGTVFSRMLGKTDKPEDKTEDTTEEEKTPHPQPVP